MTSFALSTKRWIDSPRTIRAKPKLVKLRYFAGLSFEETAGVLGISVPTANRDLAYARA